MNIVKLTCTSCGAPIDISPDVDQVKCPYCGAGLYVQRSEGQVALKMGQQVSNSINQSTEITQTELKRLQLGQEASLLQMQLSTLQAEIRALERQIPTKQIKQQLGDLKSQEMNLIGRIKSIQASLSPVGESSYPTPPVQYVQAVESRATVYTPPNQKNWIVTYLMCMFLGFFGVHRFFTGHIVLGIIQLFTLGGFLIWWGIDLFLIAFGKFKDSKGNLLSGPQSKKAQFFAVGISVLWVLYFIGSMASQ